MELFGYIAFVFVGLSLGLIGSGGSILTVPILVYLFAVNPQLATTYSLFIVGISAVIGSMKHYKQGNLQLDTALAFGVPALISLLVIRKILLPIIPVNIISLGGFTVTKNIVLMIVFALLMVAASLSMIKSNTTNKQVHKTQKPKLILIGFLVGGVTGFLGAGGGFLIIPALLFFGNLEMKKAVGTSLIIIAANALIGFANDILGNIVIQYSFLLVVSALSISGIIIGTFLTTKINSNKLKPLFGWFVLIMGMYILVREIFF